MSNKFLMFFVNNINLKTLPKNRTFINNSQQFKNIFVREISNYFLENSYKNLNSLNTEAFSSYGKIKPQKLNLKSDEIKNNREIKKIEEKNYVENNFYPLQIEKIGNEKQIFTVYIEKGQYKIKMDNENGSLNINQINELISLLKNINQKEIKEFGEALIVMLLNSIDKNEKDLLSVPIFTEKIGNEIEKGKQILAIYIDKENCKIELDGKNFVFDIKKPNTLINFSKNIEKKEFEEFVEILNKIIEVAKTQNPDVKIEIKFDEEKIEFKIFPLKPKEENNLSNTPIEIKSMEIIINGKKENKLISFEKNKIQENENLDLNSFKIEGKPKLLEITDKENKFPDFKILEADISSINFIEKNEINFKNLYDNLIYKIKETLEETAKIKIDNKLANAEVVFNLNDNEKLVVKLVYTKNQDTVNIIFVSQNEKVLNSIRENMNFFVEVFNKENINVNIFLNQNHSNFKEQFLNYSMWQNYPIFEEENETGTFNYIEEKNYINELEVDIFI